MEVLRQGSNSPQVLLLHLLLNKKLHSNLSSNPQTAAHRSFGPATQSAVLKFQQQQRTLKVDGVVGPRTWMALGNVIDINHKAQHFLQPDPTTCWSAAVSIMLGTNMSVGSGGAMLDAPGSGKAGALSIPDPRLPGVPPDNLYKFANSYGLNCSGPHLHRAGVGGISRSRSVCDDGPIAGTDSDVTDTPRIRGCRHDRGRQCRVHDAARSRSAQGAEQ